MGTRSGVTARQASSLLRPVSSTVLIGIAAGRLTQQEVGRRLGVEADTAQFVQALGSRDVRASTAAFMRLFGKSVIMAGSGAAVAIAVTYAGYTLMDMARKMARRSQNPGEFFNRIRNKPIQFGGMQGGRIVNLDEFWRSAQSWAAQAGGRPGVFDPDQGRFVPAPTPNKNRVPAEARERRPNTELPVRIVTADIRRLMTDIADEARRESGG